MPFHNGWLPREGLTADPIGRLLKNTLLNPTLTLPLTLYLNFADRGQRLRLDHPAIYSRLKALLYLGLARTLHRYLNARALNNAVSDTTYDWTKEIVVVTGGSDGIGRHIVGLFAEKGVKTVILDVQDLTYPKPATASFYKCDITSPSAIADAAASIRREIGEPTVLVNNAGVARGKTILDSTEADIRLTFDVNTLAHYFLAKEFLPSMVRGNHGCVVTVASLAAYVCAPNMVDYASSKAASLSFHEGLTAELVTRYNAPKVRTVLVTQGYTDTALFKGFGTGDFLSPVLKAETVAEEIVKKVLSAKSGQIVLPGSGNFVATPLRSMPTWFQIGVRKDLQKVMKNWSGRQVLDPEEKYNKKEEVEEGGNDAATA